MTAIDYDAWTTTDDGEPIAQSSSPATIEALLDLLDLRLGDRVLEIGTGSGYSTALLATRTGPEGRVTSIEVDRGLVARAERLLIDAGFAQAKVYAGDGLLGMPGCAPFERIIAWTTPPRIPQAWLEQAVTGAVLVAPIHLAPVAHAHAVLRAEVDAGQLRPRSVHRGSFIESHGSILGDFRVPARFVDACDVRGSMPFWLSAVALRGNPDAAEAFLAALIGCEAVERSGIDMADHRDWQAAVAHVVAAHQQYACSAFGPWGLGIGIATDTGLAVVTGNGCLVHTGDQGSLEHLRGALRQWSEAGKPGLMSIPPDAIRLQ